MTDEDLDSFMQAVYDIGQPQSGRARADQIAQRMGLELSSVLNINEPTTDDDRLYTNLAQYCEEIGFIRKVADRYVWVGITGEGKRYVESGFVGV